MKLSIVVPIYNVENYLKDCLDSILKQNVDLNDIEVILVNDGSTDTSGSIAKTYVSRNPDLFFYFEKINGGLSDARNFGMKKARGDFLMFLDSDDKLSDDICFELFKIISHSSPELILYNYARFKNETKFDKEIKSVLTGYISKQQYLLLPPAAWNKVIRRNIMLENNLEFPYGLWYEDRGLTGQYANCVKNIYFIDKIGYWYREREGSITNTDSFNEKMFDIFPVMDLVYKQLFETEYKEELEYLFIDNLVASFAVSILPFKNKEKEVLQAVDIVNKRFPNWRKNKYLKNKSFKYRLLCCLLYWKKIGLVNLILRRIR